MFYYDTKLILFTIIKKKEVVKIRKFGHETI